MTARHSIFVLVIALFVFGQSNALAGTIINEKPCNALGAFLPCVVGPFEFGTNASGNDEEAAVEAALKFVLGPTIDLMEVEINSDDFSFDPNPITNDHAFEWWYSGPETLAYATVKASTYFAIFDIFGLVDEFGIPHSTLSTKDLITNVIDEGKTEPVDVSHVTYWKQVNEVPEPSTLSLLGLGLLGFAYLARRSRQR